MAWGLEARVPFLDKAFLEVAMNVDPKAKMFSKGAEQGYDEDGCPKMEKVNFCTTPPYSSPNLSPL
jgi:asparagine synthase (glutamine-hydrolysing)